MSSRHLVDVCSRVKIAYDRHATYEALWGAFLACPIPAYTPRLESPLRNSYVHSRIYRLALQAGLRVGDIWEISWFGDRRERKRRLQSLKASCGRCVVLVDHLGLADCVSVGVA